MQIMKKISTGLLLATCLPVMSFANNCNCHQFKVNNEGGYVINVTGKTCDGKRFSKSIALGQSTKKLVRTGDNVHIRIILGVRHKNFDFTVANHDQTVTCSQTVFNAACE